MDRKCPEIYCHWVRDCQESNHYYCLRCGRERWVNRSHSSDDWWFWILLFFLAVIIAVAMG
ncbi:MAG TPA: hypothetical protein VK211_15145 [Kamptonema sp.]|nr:hypothetical protein [Kamptonema sp.]